MRGFDLGMSALRAHQQALAVHGNNIANAQTPGYSRQQAQLVDRAPLVDGAHLIGSGVDVGTIRRFHDQATASAIGRNTALQSLVGVRLDVAKSVEGLLTPGEGSIHSQLSDTLNRLEEVAGNPEVHAVRGEFLAAATSLTNAFNSMDGSLDEISVDMTSEARHAVEEINGLIEDITELHKEIQYARAKGRAPNDLLDRRDQLVGQLSEWVEAETKTVDLGREVLLIGNGALYVGTVARTLELDENTNGTLRIESQHNGQPLTLASGRLTGLVEAVNNGIPAARDELSLLADQIVRSFDQQHAVGLTDPAGYSSMRGLRKVKDPSFPLSQTGLAFPIAAGDLSVSVTDKATGLRTTERISIDPAVDSLDDITSRIDAVDGISAYVDLSTNQLVINASPGHGFDFAGRIDQVPDLSSVTGTSEPRFSGEYTGSNNDQWSVTFSGAGTVGVTLGLTATVRDQAGQVLTILDIGQGYEPGKALEIKDGVSLQFASGTVDATDTFSVPVTAVSDEGGVLSALGLNSLFVGSGTGEYKVRDDIAQSPGLLAVSSTGFVGDSTNIAEMASLRDFRFAALEDRTFVETLADMTAIIGLDVQETENQLQHLETFGERLQAERESLSGVDPAEELLYMMQVERAFQAAARFLTTVNETLGEVLRIGS